MIVLFGFTVVSGVEYFWGLRATLVRRFARVPLEVVRLAALAAVVPVGFLPVMQRDGAPIWAILAVLAFELAAGGVDNSLAQVGIVRGPWPDLARAALQAVLAGGMTATLVAGGPPLLAQACGMLALAVTAGDVFGRFLRHRERHQQRQRLLRPRRRDPPVPKGQRPTVVGRSVGSSNGLFTVARRVSRRSFLRGGALGVGRKQSGVGAEGTLFD